MKSENYFPRLSNGNIMWQCEYCNDEMEVNSPTRRVALMCRCGKMSPKCNEKYYCQGEYFKEEMN